MHALMHTFQLVRKGFVTLWNLRTSRCSATLSLVLFFACVLIDK